MKRIIKSLIATLSLAVAIPCLNGCSDEFWEETKSNVSDWWGDVSDGAEDAWNKTSEFVKDTITTIQEGSQDTIETISDWFQGAADDTVRITKDVTTKVKDFTVTSYNTVSDFVTDCKDGVVEFYNSQVKRLRIEEAGHYSDDLTAEYLDDVETFVYAQLFTELSKGGKPFVAKVFNPATNSDVVGIAVDIDDNQDKTEDPFPEYYEDDKGNLYSYVVFIAEPESEPFNENDLATGLEVLNCFDSDDTVNYIYGKQLVDYESHFIRNDTYVVYGVNNGRIYFTEYENKASEYKEDIGGLYDYDEKTWVNPGLFGEENAHISTDGNLLVGDLEPSKWAAACYNKLSSFHFSLSLEHISNLIGNVATFINEFLASIEESTILGYRTTDVITAITGSKESAVLDFANNQFNISPIPENPNATVSTAAKTLLIVGTVILLLFSIFASLFMKAYPWISIIASTLASMMLYITLEIVVEQKNFTQLNWTKIIIVGITATLIPLVGGKFARATVLAIQATLFSIMDNNTLLRSGLTFASIFVLTLLFETIFEKIGVAINDKFPQINEFIDSHQIVFHKTNSINGSEFNTNVEKTLFDKQVKQIVSDNNHNFIKVDKDGNILTKADIRKNGIRTYDIKLNPDADADVIEQFANTNIKPGDEVINMINGEPFAKFSVLDLKLPAGNIGVSRSKTFALSDQMAAEKWTANNNLIPNDFKEFLVSNGVSLDRISASDIKMARSALGYTWHEVNGTDIQLVPTALHKLISHMGGFATQKLLIASNNMQLLAAHTLPA